MRTLHRTLLVVCGLLMIIGFGGTVRAQAVRSIVAAVKNGDVAGLRALVHQGIDVNRPAGDSTTALHWAGYRGDDAAVALLLAARANPNATTDIGITPLWLATTIGHGVVVKRLLNAGASRAGAKPVLGPRRRCRGPSSTPRASCRDASR